MNEERLIAEVYPLQRLPRRFSVFDYLTPGHRTPTEGEIVQIPFRNHRTFGVVKRVLHKRVSVERLKSILPTTIQASITHPELAWYEWIAFDTIQSVPSVLHASMPQPSHRSADKEPTIVRSSLKIRQSELPTLERLQAHVNGHRRAFIHVVDLVQMVAIIQKFIQTHPNDRVAVITSQVREARWLSSWITGTTALFTGEERTSTMFERWQALRGGTVRILIGTRRAALLTPAKTDSIFVLRSSHPQHKQSEQNPRFDTRDILWEQSERFGTKLYFLDASPRADDLERFGKTHVLFQHPVIIRPIIVDLNVERVASPHPFISLSAVEAMENALDAGTRVLCIFSKKGKARTLHCQDCGLEFPCPSCTGRFTVYETTIQCHHCARTEPLPLSCPDCHGQHLAEKGYGNHAIQKALQTLFRNRTISIIERGNVADLDADILLATSYYFESLYNPQERPQRLGLVVLLDADSPLYGQTFRSFEQAILRVEEMRGLAYRCQTPLLVQTHTPEMFRRYYDEPERFFTDELFWRKRYQQPPYRRRFRLLNREQDSHRARVEMNETSATLSALPNVEVWSTGESRSTKHPQLEAMVESQALPTVLATLSDLPDHVIIDTNV